MMKIKILSKLGGDTCGTPLLPFEVKTFEVLRKSLFLWAFSKVFNSRALWNLFFFYRQLKSSLIGSNKAKNRVIEAGVVPRLLNLLTEPTVTHPDLKVAVAYALGKNVMIKVKVEKI